MNITLLSQEEAPSQRIPDIIKNYNRIGFLGIAFSNIVPSICTSENAEILKDRLCKTDFNFEILFLRPFSNLAEMRRKELKFIDPSSNISRNARQIQEFKESVIKEIPSNKQIEAKTRFRVLFYNVMPKHAITRLNDELCVSPYFISEKGAESHFLMLLKRPGYLYEKYLKYYEDVLNNFSKGFEDVELLDQNVCPHAILCKNFKIFSRQECDYCGETITGHHLHDLAKGFRLCYTCTKLLISGDLLEKYNPRFSNLNEKKICTNFKNCFNGKDFILFHDKKCEKCGAATGDIHFHDVNQNIRLCINCLKNRLE